MPHELLFGVPLFVAWTVAAILTASHGTYRDRWVGWVGMGLALFLAWLFISYRR